MRDLLESGEAPARLAVDYFVYQVAKQVGALAAVLGGLDALVFTAGIGENSPEIRRRVCEACAWLGIEFDQEANTAKRPCISRKTSAVCGPAPRVPVGNHTVATPPPDASAS